MKTENHISCPKCGFEINVSDVLHRQIEEQFRKDFEQKSVEKEKEFQTQKRKLESQQKELEEEKRQQEELIEKQTQEKLKTEKTKLETLLRKQIDDEKSDELKVLRESLQKKSEQVKELNRTKAEIEKLKLEKAELREEIILEQEKMFSNRLENERKVIAQRVEEQHSLKIKELEKKLQDQTELAVEMKRKAEQGSSQLQGEVQELAIEKFLRDTFPNDLISEVPKGIKGADAIQYVRNQFGAETGIILYESKRTKTFGKDWVGKLKSDALLVKANLCVIVTEALPEWIDRVGQIDGVWVCTFNDFKGMAILLRDSLIRINEAYSSQMNKGEKMQMLYDYLTGSEFRLQVEAIVEGFGELQKGYHQERQSMERIWKQREKQLEKVLLNANRFIGSIQGIAGQSMPNLKLIEQSEKIQSENNVTVSN
jgi:hypothetical protein